MTGATALRGLDGRVALVTGAGQGIGAAIAARLGDEGCRVAVNSLQPAKAAATAERLRGAGAVAHAFPADVADASQVNDMVAGVEEALGPVEILVNNAAYLDMERMVDQDPGIWNRMIDVDLTGPF
ncbi:MAG TPA: SDR family NAD(P)-dependent oxidoreductase, partial [Actinomycetota bacterium]|nr:SDR family NAD(P)-dependent oxidoreductase [Actinomycetota bacterium]